jgi:anti-sigma regulatory factor (Ser/Thr protein kinase)
MSSMVATLHERIEAMPAEVGRLRKRVLQFVRSECRGCSSRQLADNLALVFTEACSNAVVHAYPGEAHGWIVVGGTSNRCPRDVDVVDDGVGLGPDACSCGYGMGFALMRGLADVLSPCASMRGHEGATHIAVSIMRSHRTFGIDCHGYGGRDSTGP